MRLGARDRLPGLGAAALLALALATTAQAAPRAATAEVTIAGFAFSPATVTVNVGDSVRWTNRDAAPHSAMRSGTDGFSTGTLAQGQSGSVTFSTAGTFAYVCGIHGSSMRGTVVVLGPSPTPTPTRPATSAPTVAPPAPAPSTAPAAAATAPPTASPAETRTGGYDYDYGSGYGDPSAASSAPAATPATAAAQPTASATGARAADEGWPAPLLAGAGVLLILGAAGAAWRLRRR